jgi:hypothetical protein
MRMEDEDAPLSPGSDDINAFLAGPGPAPPPLRVAPSDTRPLLSAVAEEDMMEEPDMPEPDAKESKQAPARSQPAAPVRLVACAGGRARRSCR